MLELGKEVMGALALAVFWVHVLLVAGAAWLDLRDLLRLRRSLRPLSSARAGAVGLLRGVVRRGDGEEGVLARNIVEQVGRGKGDGKVHFSDAAHRSEAFGGAIELDDKTTLSLAAVEAVAVWPDLQRRREVAQPSSSEQIAKVEAQARRAKGWRREVAVGIGEGQAVWVGGRVIEEENGSRRIEPAEGRPVLISAIDPRAWLARKCALVVGFIVAELAVAAGCTVVALWPPLFDWVSMLGAAAALGFFLGVQPLGVSLNEGVRTPDRAYLRGSWGA